MSFITWIIVGALAGWIGSMIMKTNAQMGAIANIVVGILGAVIGGWVLDLFGFETSNKDLIPSILTAILGAVILIGILKAVTGKKVIE